MKPNNHNPFAGKDGEGMSHSHLSAQGGVHADGASFREPSPALHASLAKCAFGWQADLAPMRAFEALRIWSKMSANPEAVSLLFNVAIKPASQAPRLAPTPKAVPRVRSAGAEDLTLGMLADRLSIRSVECFDDEQLVMDSMALRELVGMIEQAHLRCVLVEGPIEPRDAIAMRSAVIDGKSPLSVELRAAASLEVANDEVIIFQSRQKKNALHLVAESFRVYLSTLRKRPIDEVASPETWQIERLLDLSGSISVRPKETDSFSTFLDVGISTASEPFAKPADRSLIYDIPSNTWHDEK